MTPAETREYQERLDTLEARARKDLGVDFASASVTLQSNRTLELFPDRKPYVCRVGLGSIPHPKGDIHPPNLEAYGDCQLSAIEAAHREIARRVLEERESAA